MQTVPIRLWITDEMKVFQSSIHLKSINGGLCVTYPGVILKQCHASAGAPVPLRRPCTPLLHQQLQPQR